MVIAEWSPCPYLHRRAFHCIFSPLSSWGGAQRSDRAALVGTWHPARVNPPHPAGKNIQFAWGAWLMVETPGHKQILMQWCRELGPVLEYHSSRCLSVCCFCSLSDHNYLEGWIVHFDFVWDFLNTVTTAFLAAFQFCRNWSISSFRVNSWAKLAKAIDLFWKMPP